MDQKKLSLSLKIIIAGVGVCALAVYAWVLPACGDSVRLRYPEFASCYWPWLVFLWITAVPCLAALVFAWRIAKNIGADRSFSVENARLLRIIAYLAAGDTLYFFLGNVVLLFFNMNHPGIILFSLLICFAGLSVTVAAVCLSHLVRKAADLQDESDLTV